MAKQTAVTDELKTNSRLNLLHTLSWMSSAERWIEYEQTAFVSAVPELFAQWQSGFIQRAWFMEMFTPDQVEAMRSFDAFCQSLSEKYNRWPSVAKFVASKDGRDVIARAAGLRGLLSAPPAE